MNNSLAKDSKFRQSLNLKDMITNHTPPYGPRPDQTQNKNPNQKPKNRNKNKPQNKWQTQTPLQQKPLEHLNQNHRNPPRGKLQPKYQEHLQG